MRKVWQQALRALEEQLPPKDYTAWIAPIRPCDLAAGTATLEVPNGFFRDWVRQYFLPQLTDALSHASGAPCRVALVVNKELGISQAPRPAPVEQVEIPQTRVVGRLVPEYTMDTFVVGHANELAAEAALGVSAAPGTQFNPLFIYGGVGVGKTHLMNAIGHAVLDRHVRARIGCLTAEAFVNAMIDGLRRDRMDAFRKRFRRIDVLIIDDVQFLGGKVRSQEEFFHTFNALREGGKQIVLASDRPPQEIRDIQECLQSRFSSGLLAPMSLPDDCLRARIVARKAAGVGLELEPGLAEMIAASIRGNVRQLEGMLNAIRARVQIGGQAVTRALVRGVLGASGLRGDRGGRVEAILDAVAAEFQVSVEEILSSRRTARIVEARQAAIALCRELTDLPLTGIGERVGGRDHSTVIYALARVAERVEKRPEFRQRIERVRARIENG
jgi:chromosomal replication initiator protein